MCQTTQKVACPKCPYCGEETVAISVECHDKSGWICGWTCNCEFINKWENYVNKKETPAPKVAPD